MRSKIGKIITYFFQRLTQGIITNINHTLKLIKKRVDRFKKIVDF
jgi:hypothetical protein